MSKKQMNTRIQYKYDSAEEWAKCTTKSLAGELYVHSHDNGSMSLSIGDGMRQIKYLPTLGGEVNKPEPEPELISVAKPVITNMPVYTGEYQIPVVTYDSTAMGYMNSHETYKDCGEIHSANFDLNEGYCWKDGDESRSYSLQWYIEKATDNIRDTMEVSLSSEDDWRGPDTFEVREADTATITINPVVDDFHVRFYWHESRSTDELCWEVLRKDNINYTEDINVETFVTIDRPNFITETIKLKINAEAKVIKYTWNVYSTTKEYVAEKAYYDDIVYLGKDYGDNVYFEHINEQVQKYSNGNGYTDNCFVYYEGDSVCTGSEIWPSSDDGYPATHYHEPDPASVGWQNTGRNTYMTVPCGVYTVGTYVLITESERYKYEYVDSKKYVKFNKGSYVDTVESTNYLEYPVNTIRQGKYDAEGPNSNWYWYERA